MPIIHSLDGTKHHPFVTPGCLFLGQSHRLSNTLRFREDAHVNTAAPPAYHPPATTGRSQTQAVEAKGQPIASCYVRSDSLHPSSDSLHPSSDSLHPRSDSLHPSSDGLHPRSDGLLSL